MTNRGDAGFSALPAAGKQRIGSHINVRPVVVFIGKPAMITRRKRTLQRHDALLCRCRNFVAKQKSDRVTRREATTEKVTDDSIHGSTSIRPFLHRSVLAFWV